MLIGHDPIYNIHFMCTVYSVAWVLNLKISNIYSAFTKEQIVIVGRFEEIL